VRKHARTHNVPHIQQGDDFAAALSAAGLIGSARLAVLDLSENSITCVGAAHLAAALEAAADDRCALRQLDLGFNRVGDAGAAALARAVPAVASLASLELESNEVGDDGALALAEAVRMAPSLQRLNLNFNRLSGRAVAGLADALLCSPGEGGALCGVRNEEIGN
jgi:Ran GTPase-activating protein (RanGAP) involved in mRNA processing and transport